MGTRWTATLIAGADTDMTAVETALAGAVDLVDRQMSTWRPDSDLMRLNSAPPGTWVALPDALLQVLETANHIGRLSDGAFDIGLGALVNAWGFGAAGPEADIAAIKSELAQDHPPTHETLEVDRAGGRARNRAATALDLSGIAKGFGVDEMHKVVEGFGLSGALLGLDGELYAKGRAADGAAWPIAIEKPDYEARTPLSVLEVEDAAVATSGDYRHWVEVGQTRLSHTMDRRRGGPAQGRVASVTVIGKSCMEADAWATALLVFDAENGPELAAKHGLDALFVLRDGDGYQQIPVGPVFNGA